MGGRPRRRLSILAAVVLGVPLLGALALELWRRAPANDPPPEVHMPPSTILVIYYSRTGTTAKLARSIAEPLGADVVPLVDTVGRAGPFGFIRSIFDAAGKRRTTLQPLGVDPARYELVLVGTPVWGSSVSAPVRAFFQDYRGRLPEVGFFLTDGESSHEAVFRDMTELAGREPVARLGVAHDDVVQDRCADRVAAFVRSLRAGMPVARSEEPARREPRP